MDPDNARDHIWTWPFARFILNLKLDTVHDLRDPGCDIILGRA